MTRSLIDKRTASLLASFSAVAALACGTVTMVGCGSSNNGGGGSGSTEGGIGSDAEAGSLSDAGDSGPATGTDAEAGSPLPDSGETTPPPQACASPVFAPPPGTFASSTAVTITAGAGDEIFYLTNGMVPTAATGTLYISGSPVNIATVGSTTLVAIATGTNCTPSAPTSGIYKITAPPPGTCNAPAPSVAAGAYNNDFKLGLTVGSNAGCMTPTVCYTLDGSPPSCAAGVCSGTSKTYDGVAQVSIDGTVTNPSTGTVTVNAIACESGATDGTLAAGAKYTLQVATPTLNSPAADPTVHPYLPAATAGSTVHLPTLTVASTTAGATALYTKSATNMPSCSNGTPVGAGALPQTIAPGAATGVPLLAPGLDEDLGNQTFYVEGCKPGYAPSTVLTAPYTITLNPPTFSPPGGKTYNADTVVTLQDTNAGAQGVYYCYTSTAGVTPACGTTTAAPCNTGSTMAPGSTTTVPNNTALPIVHVTGTDFKAIACQGVPTPSTYPFTASSVADSLAYTLQLDAVAFTPPSGTPIPTAGNLSVTIGRSTGVVGDEQYDYLCYTTDGVTVPACDGCTASATNNVIKVDAVPAVVAPPSPFVPATATISLNAASPEPIRAVGCLNAMNTSGDVFLASDTPAASASYQPATVVAAPTILPTNGTLNNEPTVITFNNNEPTTGGAAAYFCYTTDKSAPATNTGGTSPVCWAAGSTHGTTTCTTSSTAVQTASSTTDVTGTSITATGTTIRAIACDVAGVKKPSTEAAPVLYTLVAADPTITVPATLNLGGAITFSSKTASAVFHWDDAGGTPNCLTGLTTHSGTVTASGTADTNGNYNGTYYAMGAETGKLTVIACKPNFTQSANLASVTLAYSVAPPAYASAPGTYDDGFSNALSTPTGIIGTVLCNGAGAGCGPAGTCTGVGVTTIPAASCNYTADTSGQPTAGAPPAPIAPSCSFGSVAMPTTNFNPNINVIACAPATAATTAIKASPALTGTYNFQTSAVAISAPSPAANLTAPVSVVFSLVPSTLPPGGNATATPPVTAITAGNVFICASAGAQVAQPSDCATFAGAPPTGWVCSAAATPLTLTDVGANTTYSAFACKDNLTYSHIENQAVTFAPYVHTPAFPLTGATSDFTTGVPGAGENIAALDGATAYVTYDATNLYIGFDKGAAFGATDIVHFYIGTPVTGTATPNTTLDTGFGAVALPATFNAVYDVFWNSHTSAAGINAWNAGATPPAWAASTNVPTVKYNMGSTFVEIAVPLSSIPNLNGKLQLIGSDWTGAANDGTWPVGAAPANTDVAWAHYQTEVTADAFFPNDPSLVH
jgi:hypothetical protein